MEGGTQIVRLSICIATYNRARFIERTLDSILGQMQPGVELLVVDGASPDDTREVMASYIGRHPDIRYYREEVNSGVDGDYDKAVSYARGGYCWLMTDDDLLKPGAVQVVLNTIESGPDLVVLNSEVRNADFSAVLTPRFIQLERDKSYRATDLDVLFAETAGALSFIGCVVIRRAAWLARVRESYLGTLFIHVGVIFQAPALDDVRVVAEPQISIRYGNAMWTSRGFEIWMFKWPDLLWSFTQIAEHSRSTVSAREPWRQLRKLLLYRAIGGYDRAEYRRSIQSRVSGIRRLLPKFIAMLPAKWANALASVYCGLFAQRARTNLYDLVRSENASWITRLAARIAGLGP
ncbi:glycosyl transferase [Rhodanobacter sp. C05]|nr:glycosyl transferase [Rhodanobacter sp. C05]